MGFTGKETLVIDQSIVSRFDDQRGSIRDYATDGFWKTVEHSF
jgi:hypothetical protein